MCRCRQDEFILIYLISVISSCIPTPGQFIKRGNLWWQSRTGKAANGSDLAALPQGSVTLFGFISGAPRVTLAAPPSAGQRPRTPRALRYRPRVFGDTYVKDLVDVRSLRQIHISPRQIALRPHLRYTCPFNNLTLGTCLRKGLHCARSSPKIQFISPACTARRSPAE